MQACALQRTASCSSSGYEKKSPLNAKRLPYPKVSAGAVPVRAQRHVPDSIKTLRLAPGVRIVVVSPDFMKLVRGRAKRAV
jgi:hypothetical protein